MPQWLFPYAEDPASARRDRIPLRPVVAVRLVGAYEAPIKVAALVDSGSEHVLATPMLARAIGVDPDPATETTIGIGGKGRLVRFADARIQLFPDIDSEDDPLSEWDAEIGFFSHWEPPWAVLLGQWGFFSRFTVTMNRAANALAVEPWETFDERFGTLMAEQRRSPEPRLRP